ncbi:TadE/TadG family type IV pilus assembly protein [Nocardioides sp.]|uniref:TadE/TadG family type IV pilus assembly protein n=1 Tax=Nocardioides sp. TaxID=35761 RepID=UPI003563430F
MFFSARTTRNQRGAAAVEFALVAPLLMLLVFGIISYGYMLSFRQGISQGVAEGARAAAVAPAQLTATQKQTRAREAINSGLGNYGVACNSSNNLIKGGSVVGTCQVSSPQTCTGSTVNAMCVKVTVNYDYRENPLIPSVPGIGIVLPERLSVISEAQVNS